MADVLETGAGGGDLGIDLESLAAATGPVKRPFGDLCERVITESGVAVNPQTRRLASIICGPEGVAGLPFIQEDYERAVTDEKTGEITTIPVDAIREQAMKLAAIAERRLDSPMVWTPAAIAMATTALTLRKSKGLFAPDPPKPREERAAEVRAARAQLVPSA